MAKNNPKPVKKQKQEPPKSEALEQIEKELTEMNPELFKGISMNKKLELLRSFSVTLIQEQSHSGPIPDPESLAAYNTLIPNGADRIMVMAEQQQTHRLKLEKKVVGRQSFQSLLGQLFGFAIALVAIYAGYNLTMNDYPAVGGTVVGTTVVSLVYVFVIGKKRQSKD